MKESILNFKKSKEYISWEYAGQKIVKSGPNSTNVFGIKLNVSEKVLVVYLCDIFGTDNAVIYNPDGSEYKVIKNPIASAVGFGDVYYSDKGKTVTIISWFNKKEKWGFIFKKMINLQSSLACVYDEDGNLIRIHETR